MYDLKTLEFDKIKNILLNYIKTDYAKKLVLNSSVSNDILEIKRLNLETKEAYNAIVKYGDINLDGLIDLNNILKRATLGSNLNAIELNHIVSMLDISANTIKYFKNLDAIKLDYTNLKPYLLNLNVLPPLKSAITLAISSDGNVLDNASKELFMIRRNIKSQEIKLKNKLNELLVSEASKLTEPLIVTKDSKLCLPVKVEYKNSFKGVIHDISSSNTTVYIEPSECVNISNQIESLKNDEKKEIDNILKALTLLVSANDKELNLDFNSLTNLDIIYAKAYMGYKLNYNEANIVFENKFNLKNIKHPLIDKDRVVPIDIELGKKFDVIVITGPNTGGKTVALKTVGLLHLMAYFGMMVPADLESSFGYFSDILVDIGDEQSIEQSLSTFSSHLTKTIKILDLAKESSLILLDELGSGTDPKEGSSLAIAIIDYLKGLNAKVICTTHYSELKSYAYDNDRICNASVEFNNHSLMPTYKLLLGIPGKSNALEIAKRLGLNETIINNALNHLNENATKSSNLLNNLEEELNNLREKEDILKKKNLELENKINDFNKEKKEFEISKDKIINKAKKEALEIVRKSQEDATKLIDEIKNMSSEAFKEHELASIKHKVRSLSVKEEDEKTDYNFNVGDYVYVKSYEKYGTITKIKKDKYTVNIGQFSIDFSSNDLRIAEKPNKKPIRQTKLSGYNPRGHASLSLDLRGKRYEEVKDLIDQYIDQALVSNLSSVTIIHGFGTGAVRTAVWEYLKTCPYVKSYRYGGEGEGLNGVTIVTLK